MWQGNRSRPAWNVTRDPERYEEEGSSRSILHKWLKLGKNNGRFPMNPCQVFHVLLEHLWNLHQLHGESTEYRISISKLLPIDLFKITSGWISFKYWFVVEPCESEFCLRFFEGRFQWEQWKKQSITSIFKRVNSGSSNYVVTSQQPHWGNLVRCLRDYSRFLTNWPTTKLLYLMWIQNDGKYDPEAGSNLITAKGIGHRSLLRIFNFAPI